MFDLAQSLVLLLLGGMVFFPSVVAPVVFMYLPEAQAAIFLRAMFPRYYVFMIVLSLAGSVMYQLSEGAVVSVAALVCLGVGLSTLWVRQGLLPRINAARDAQLAQLDQNLLNRLVTGDAGAGRRWQCLRQT